MSRSRVGEAPGEEHDVDPMTDPRCLVITEGIIIDGANGICRAPRMGARTIAPDILAVHAAVLAVSAIALARGRSWRGPRATGPARAALALVTVAAVAGATSGYHALAQLRADAPARRASSVREITALLGHLDAFASAHGGRVDVDSEACVECQPIARLAVPIPVPSSAATMLLLPGALGGACAHAGDALWCGPADDGAPRHPDAP